MKEAQSRPGQILSRLVFQPKLSFDNWRKQDYNKAAEYYRESMLNPLPSLASVLSDFNSLEAKSHENYRETLAEYTKESKKNASLDLPVDIKETASP